MGYHIFKVWDEDLWELLLFLHELSNQENYVLYTTCLNFKQVKLMTSHRLRYDMEFHEQTYIKKDKNINSHMQINFGDIKTQTYA